MVTTILDSIASRLVSVNRNWLTQIRTTGYLNKAQDGDLITNDEVEEIGLTDTAGNSGYIRFLNEQNCRIDEIPAIVSDVAFKYTYALRLVVLAKSKTPIDLGYLLSLQINHLSIGNIGTASFIRTKAVASGSNTISIFNKETTKEISNVDFRAFYVDFALVFTDNNKCNFDQLIQLPMDCNCTTVFAMPCVGKCDTIELPANASYSGEATLITHFNGQRITQALSLVDGEPISIEAETLTPNYTYNLQVINAEGEVITYTVDAVVYDCFEIKIEA